MTLKPNVDFRVPVCVAYEYVFCRGCGMQTFAGTYAGSVKDPDVIGFRLARRLENFGSMEECELTAAARGQPFLRLEDDCGWIGEDPAVLEFVSKYNPEAVTGA